MEKKVIIIIWKWDDLNENDNKNDNIETEKNDLIVRILDRLNVNEIQTLLINTMETPMQSDVIILIHTGTNSSIGSISDLTSSSEKLTNKKNLIFDFSGGGRRHFVYANDSKNPTNGLLDQSGDFQKFDDGYSVINKEGKIKQANFDSVWKHYFEKIIIKVKQELIFNWLPLAIDIQGLSEVHQKSIKETDNTDLKEKAKEYWKKIKESHNRFDNLITKHNNIAGDYKKLKFDNTEGSSELKKFLNALDKQNEAEPPAIYLNPEGDFFFPNWSETFAKNISKIEKIH